MTTLGSEHRVQSQPRIRLTSLWQGSAKDPCEECSRSAQPYRGMEPGPALGPFWNNNSRQSRQKVNILVTIPHLVPLLEITIHICKLELPKSPQVKKKKKESWKQVSLKVTSRHNHVDTQSFKEHLSNTCSVSGMCQAPGQQQSERQARSIPSRSLHSRRENAKPTKQ